MLDAKVRVEIEIDDELFAGAQAFVKGEGITLDELIERALIALLRDDAEDSRSA